MYFFKQFYLGCLAHASYLLGSNGEAAVIDPQRDVQQYIDEAKAEGLAIKYVIETHLHADFVSGHKELSDRTGAQIVFGKTAAPAFPYLGVQDGDCVRVGNIELRFLETPGHTPESICVVARDLSDDTLPERVFTGDTLFIGDVGRPDLVGAKGYSADTMASMMYDSLHKKLMKLSDDTEVYPAHGAGSLCGKRLSGERTSTIGQQKLFNYALKAMSRDEFVKLLIADQPEVPQYFPKDVEMNRLGASSLDSLDRPQPLSAQDTSARLSQGAVLLDVRTGQDYAREHVTGSLNIGLGGQFASWAGTLIPIETPIILLAYNEKTIDEAVMRLARVGIQNVIGYLSEGVESWSTAGLGVSKTEIVSVGELDKKIAEAKDLIVLDVRRQGEFMGGHVPGAINIPLAELFARVEELSASQTIAVICASGYRSSIAVSILEQAGKRLLLNVLGGTAAWRESGFAIEEAIEVTA